ncbi:uncharacterized protein LOC119280294 [Triticum dicoccoides]|uniref:uncharacterized protein LOC119280294 n=1 Tax=Triticum dicoccoides TaxID=85692 RepID=UPI00188E2285|nr:uncharacterized protein LOC119280294 [Triticum dicoccoides]
MPHKINPKDLELPPNLVASKPKSSAAAAASRALSGRWCSLPVRLRALRAVRLSAPLPSFSSISDANRTPSCHGHVLDCYSSASALSGQPPRVSFQQGCRHPAWPVPPSPPSYPPLPSEYKREPGGGERGIWIWLARGLGYRGEKRSSAPPFGLPQPDLLPFIHPDSPSSSRRLYGREASSALKRASPCSCASFSNKHLSTTMAGLWAVGH